MFQGFFFVCQKSKHMTDLTMLKQKSPEHHCSGLFCENGRWTNDHRQKYGGP